MSDILVTENIVGREMDALRRERDVAFEPELWKSPERLREEIGRYRAVIVRNQTKVDAALIAAGRRLQVIGRAGVGLENVDAKAATDAGVVVAYAPSQNTISVAELAIGLMLSLARMIPAADRSTKAGGWERQRFTGVELYGKTLGVVGLGKIGYMVATRARAFGMDVAVFDPVADPDSFTVTELRARLLPSLHELLAESDVVTVHTPETPQTIGMFDDDAFAAMRPGAFLLNTARGRVIDEAALVRALQSGRLGGAALDVRATEPPQRDALCEMENVILTPHVAAFTREGQKRVVASVCRDVEAVLSGGAARHAFNFPKPRGRAADVSALPESNGRHTTAVVAGPPTSGRLA